jgi:hypothetical protein
MGYGYFYDVVMALLAIGGGLRPVRVVEEHHSDPIFMEGDPNQPLTTMEVGAHRRLHADLNAFLRGITDDFGNDMSPRRGNSAERIRSNFSRDERLDALAEFYRRYAARYVDAACDFFRQHPDGK